MAKSRRSRGDGGVFYVHKTGCECDRKGGEQKCDGRWRAQVETGVSATGATVYATKTRKTKTAAQDALKVLRKQVEQGVRPDQSMTFGKWLDYYIDEIKADRAPKTRQGYRDHAERWLIPPLGKKKLVDIRPEDLEGVYNRIRKAGKVATLQQVHAVAHGALKTATTRRMLPYNPAAMVEISLGRLRTRVAATQAADPQAVVKKKVFTETEARTLLTAAEEHSLEMYVRALLALMLGIRPGEALGLRWCDVDLAAKKLMIRHALVRDNPPAPEPGSASSQPVTDKRRRTKAQPKGPYVLGPTKTKLPRELPIPATLHEALTEWKAARRPGQHDFVLPMLDQRPGRQGVRVSDPDQVDADRWEKFVAASGVPYAPRYASRRTVGTLMADGNVPMATVRDILGHTNVATTASFYVMPDVEMKARGTDALDNLLH